MQDKVPSRDDLIVDQIKDQLEEKMQASAMDINVFCKDGIVHMSGIVDVLAEKRTAEDIARGIEGIKKLENKITVAMDGNFTDKHMEKEVLNKLRKNDKLNGVGAKIEDGVANLIGTAQTLKDSKFACELASEIRGIKDVVNNIKVSPDKEYDDVTINNRIAQALSTTNLSYEEDITHAVKEGKVVLNGYVNTRNEAELAKEITMGIEGVKKVVNKLKIRKDQEKQF
jgi:osmotically-inducible protein OsmY